MKQSLKLSLVSLSLFGLLAGCSTTQYPVTDMQAINVEQNCQTSFWSDCVGYPFPVKYANTQDAKGINWQIAYMDEYRGTEPNPTTVVLIHGKGMHAGYYAEIMKDLLIQGYRVIAPDLPNYGKSIPGNLNNPVTRSLDDTRDAIHDLLANQLKLQKAHFLGHSMGGQWVLGYALKYPSMVDKIVLEAPGGIEEFPTTVANIPFFGEAQADSYEAWSKIWGGMLKTEQAKTAQDIELFNYFKAKNPKTGTIMDSPAGYFLVETPVTDYITHTRQYMIDASPEEFAAWTQTYIRDVYSMGEEVRIDDPNSLVKRIAQIEAPILITYGAKEPFIPTTIFSGKQNLKWDVIKPVYDALAANGNAPTVKVYPDAGHFIHTDIPTQFNQDVINYLADKRLANADNVKKYKAPLITPPEEVQVFFDAFKKDLLKQDKTAIANYYANDFMENGFDKNSFLAVLYSQMKNVKDYKVSLVKFEQDKATPGEYFIEGMVDLGLMKVPFKPESKVRKTEQGWQWLGNRKS
ncbi:alpha/beta fold hydrolase [Shewanella marina]|uniref:alpha/beta fold hydrolase n=1 Tax=Shewanella marina TaxID=487319 RepID=UPI000470BAF0|nr:alpha/beta hydrolase [Shewanella marina]